MFLEKCPTTDLQTDASKFVAGAFYRGDWLHHAFTFDSPSVRDLHILNYKEVLANIHAAKHWSKDWSNKHMIISPDNTTAVSIINKGTCFCLFMGFPAVPAASYRICLYAAF